MANTNEPGFSSLDPLGPEYGSINAPRLDSKGLAPFEGERLEMPKINFPEPEQFTQVLPNVQNLDNPAKQIQRNVVGVSPQRPGVNTKADPKDLSRSMKDYVRNKMRANQDNNQYAKIYSYNAGPDGNAFYKRYQAYGQETFDRIGFSPIRDNEALFNSRTTQWDDFTRMMQHSFIPLFSQGFMSGPKSLGKMLGGDFTGADLEDAEAYEEAAAIGQSSKGGFGGFVSNTMMNFAYTAGIITEAVLEEVVLAVATGATAGVTAPALFTRTATNVGRVFKGLKGFNFAVDGMKAINKTLDTLSSVKGAREFWDMTKGFRSTVNPLSSTFEAYRTASKADNFTNLARAYKTAGGFYRDVRNMNMALSEARLEAGMVENHIYDNLYNEYYAKNGKAPDTETQYDMIKQAKKGSLDTLYWNTGLIYASNMITFPNIVGPKGGVKGFVRNTIKEISEVSGGKFGNLGKVVYDQTAKKFAFEKNNFVNWAKGWAKNPIHKSVGSTLGYFKANFTEGIQENLQEVIGGANERYYTDTFKSKGVQAHNYSKSVAKFDYYRDELGKQFSGQGFETFASGFLMGTFAAPLNKLFEYSSIGYNRMFDKEAYQELKDKKLEITDGLVNNLNSIDIKDFLDSRMFNYGRQEAIAKIKETGTEKQARDADHEGLLEQMDMLMRNNSFDSFKEKLYDLQKLTPEEFEDNVPTVPKGEGAKYQARIDETIQKMDRISNRYKTYQEKMPSPVDLQNLPPKGTPEYVNAVSLHNAWEETIKNAVFFNETFEDTMRRKRDIIQRFNSQKPLESLSQIDSEVIFDNNRLRNEIGLLKNEIDNLKELSDPASKEEVKKKERKLKAMEELGAGTVNFINFFNRYERSQEIREALQKEKGDEPVTDEEVEAVMDEYFGEFTDENKIKNLSDYETAFKNYLKAVADVNNDYFFDEKIDNAFQLLVDHQKLDSESRALMKGVNMLHDPQGFLDLVERNQKWMKDLYARRGEIYQKMITEEFDIIVDNALLNTLANKSIYISMEDFEAWKLEGIPPSEFYDHARKLIIPDGTEEYEMYYMLFEQAAQLKNEKSNTIPGSLEKSLDEDLDRLEQQKEAELENLPKIESKVYQKDIEPTKAGNVTLKMIEKNLLPGSYAEAYYGEEEPLIFYMDPSGELKENDADGEVIDSSKQSINFESVKTYTISEQPDPTYAAEIEKKYEELKNERLATYNEQLENLDKKEKEQKDLSMITSSTALEEIASQAPALYNKLDKEFRDRIISKMDSEEVSSMTSEQERNLFEKFIQGNPVAKELIDTYNKERKLEEVTQETGEVEEFEFMYQGKNVSTVDLKTIESLEKMKRRFDKMIKDIADNENPTPEEMTEKSKYSIISKNLEKLINTRLKAELPEGFRYVEENEILPAGNYVTKLSVDGKRTITNAPRKEEAEKTKPSDIEAKKAERRKRYYNGPANRMVQVQKDSENTPVTQEQIEEIEQVIEKAKELGWDKNRLFRQLSSMGYSYAFGVNPEGYRNYLEDRLSGKTNIKVTSEYNFFEQLDAELAALEEGATNTIPQNPESSDDVDSPTQDTASRKVEVIDEQKRYSIDDFKADLAIVTNKEELQETIGKLEVKVAEEAVALEDLQAMSELYKQKLEQLTIGQSKIEPANISKGTQLIAKQIIFDGDAMFAMGNDTVVVESINDATNKVKITLLGTSDSMSISFDKLNELFILKNTVMSTTKQPVPIATKEEKDMLNQSSDLADTLLNNTSKLEELEKSISGKTVKDLDSELLDDLKC